MDIDSPDEDTPEPKDPAALDSKGLPVGKRAANGTCAQGIPAPKFGGVKPGCQMLTKRKVAKDTALVIEATASSFLDGKNPIRLSPHLGPVTSQDRQAITRLTGLSGDDFQTAVAARLAKLAEMVADRMEEKLEADLYKPGELTFALAVILDKHSRSIGRTALQGASINVQVNNFGPDNREILIAELVPKGPGEMPADSKMAS